MRRDLPPGGEVRPCAAEPSVLNLRPHAARAPQSRAPQHVSKLGPGIAGSVLIPRPGSLAFDPPHHGPDGANLDALFRKIAWILGISPPIPATIGVGVDRRRQAGLWGQFSDSCGVRLRIKD